MQNTANASIEFLTCENIQIILDEKGQNNSFIMRSAYVSDIYYELFCCQWQGIIVWLETQNEEGATIKRFDVVWHNGIVLRPGKWMIEVGNAVRDLSSKLRVQRADRDGTRHVTRTKGRYSVGAAAAAEYVLSQYRENQ